MTAGRRVLSGWVLSLAKLVTGLVKVKILALALGAQGVGIYAILLQLYLTGVAVASMSLSTPIVVLGRPKVLAGDIRGAASVAGTALAVVGANAALLLLLSAAFGGELLAGLGVGETAGGLIGPLAIAIAIGAISGAFWDGMSFLSDRSDIYVRAGIVGATADMLLVAGGAASFGLSGAVYGVAAGTVVTFLAYATLISRDAVARELLRNLSARLRLLPQLFAYSAMLFATVAATNAAFTFLRSQVLLHWGAAANGHLQAVTSLSAYLLTFVMSGFWVHMYSMAAAHGDTPEVRRELTRSLSFGLLISFTGCGFAAVFAPIIIPIFYSHEFTDAVLLLVAYLPGELCFQLFWMLAAYQVAVRLRRVYLALNLGYVGLLILGGVILIPRLGAGGYVAAHVAASFIMVVAALLLVAKRGQVESTLVAKATALIVTLTVVSATLLYARNAGFSTLALTPLLLPFAISGSFVLYRLSREWFQRVAATD